MLRRSAPLLLLLAACHAPAAPRPSRVASHYLVLVTEGPDDDRHDTIVVAEPLSRVPHDRAAFDFRQAGYRVGVGWGRDAGGPCLDITVARDDFEVHGCVKTDAPSAVIGQLPRPDGTTLAVEVWFFEEGLPPRRV